MRKGLLVLVASTLLLSGCAVQKQLVPTGGSKADGTVKMSYSFGMFESPKVTFSKALKQQHSVALPGAILVLSLSVVQLLFVLNHPQADVWKQWSQWNINVLVT